MASFWDSPPVKWLILAVVLIFSLYRVFMGVDFTDSPFCILLLENSSSCGMIPLFCWVGKCWTALFGNSYVSYRFFKLFFDVSACALPFFVLIPRAEWFRRLNYLSLALLLINVRLMVFHYDILSIFFVTLMTTLLIKYYQTARPVWHFLLAVTCAISVFVRFPDVVVFPLILILLPIAEISFLDADARRFARWKPWLQFVAISAFFYVVLSFLFSGSPEKHTAMAQATFKANAVGNHSIAFLMRQILSDSAFIVTSMGFFFFFSVTLAFVSKVKYQAAFVLFACFLMFLNLRTIVQSDYNKKMLLFAVSAGYWLIFWGFWRCVERRDGRSAILLFSITLLSLVNIAGSNTGFLNAAPFLMFFLPFMFWLIPDLWKAPFPEPALAAVPTGMFLFAVVLSGCVGFEDVPYWKMDTCFETPAEMRGMWTTGPNVQLVQNVVRDYRAMIEKKPIVFYGTRSHLFFYLLHEKNYFGGSHWMFPTDEEDVNKLQRYISQNDWPTVFSVPSTFHLALPFDYPVASMLKKNGYKEYKKQNYTIFYRP